MIKSELVILIAHYNNPDGLINSLTSIQEDFPIDVLIVDDGSKEKFKEKEILNSYVKGKVYFEYLQTNSGVGVAANHGLKKIESLNYKYIGRLDCGDLCYPNKFHKQLTYLESNPELKLLGTWVRVIDEKGNFLYNLKHPTSYSDIKKKMYLNSMFVNPTVVFYSEILKTVGNYPHKYRYAAQDFAFFFNVIKKFRAENYPEILLDYVVEKKSISTKKRKLQVKNRILIILENFNWKPLSFYSLIRNSALYFFPRNILEKTKSIFK